ncbi:MAG: hypothetical protein AAFX75_11340 [Pseudomonadota bacterium]
MSRSSLRAWCAAVLTLAFGASACTISTPYRTAASSDERGDTVFVSVTHAVVKENRASRRLFFEYVENVEESLPASPGYVGFSKRMVLFGNDAWTMTVWKDEASLERFVRSDAHQIAIRNAFVALESARFARVEMAADDAPLSWEQALAALESEARTY